MDLIKAVKEISVDEYKKLLTKYLEYLRKITATLVEMKYVMNDKWFCRVEKTINDFDDNLIYHDGAYDLFRILQYEFPLNVLEERIINIKTIAKKQGKLRLYRKTHSELGSKQTNQVLGSLFEINILSGLIKSFPSIELFPASRVGGGDVEAKFVIDDRHIYLEAKAFGYSKHDPVGRVGVHSVQSMVRQIFDGLNSKIDTDQQLYKLSTVEPTVLALSLGFNADSVSCSWAIEEFFTERKSNISFVLVFGSALCRRMVGGFSNKHSSFRLSDKERHFINTELCTKIMF